MSKDTIPAEHLAPPDEQERDRILAVLKKFCGKTVAKSTDKPSTDHSRLIQAFK